MFGSGAIIVIDDRACMVQLGLRVAQFYMHESCGKCTPCREGTRWMVQILHKLEDGEASQADLDLLLDVCDRILGKCLCPLGDAAAMPVASYIDRFRDEFQAHFDGGCPMHGESSLEHCSRPSTSTRTAPSPRCPRECAGARHADDRRPRGRGREGHRARRDRRRRRDRDPGLLLRAAARAARRRLPDVPRRGRGDPEAPGRLHADRAGRDGRPHRRDLGRRPPRARTRRSSSSSSTTRSTARSATRAASARSRT